MRYEEYADQPSFCAKKLVGEPTLDHENAMRIAEILSLLGFLHTPRNFAKHHLGMDPQQVDEFLAGDMERIASLHVHILRDRLNAVQNVLTQEVADAVDVDEQWKAQARHKLMQTAFAHLV